MKKIALVSLPEINTPVQEKLNNLNGYWQAPPCVIEQWSGCCKVEYHYDYNYDMIKEEVLKSYNECIKQFYTDNAL